jgi:transposase
VDAVHAPDRLNMISAITPKGAMSFDVFTGRFNAGVFIEFLKKLMHDATGPVFVVVDNPSHTARAVRDYVASQDGRLKLFFLPSYSPELNPDEWVWKNVKHDQVGRAALLPFRVLRTRHRRPRTPPAAARDHSCLLQRSVAGLRSGQTISPLSELLLR